MGMYDHLPYRLGVGIMLLNHEGLVFVANRIDSTAEAWQMPQGGIDVGELPLAAALRELKEEIGTNDVTVVAESADWYSYDLPDKLIPKIWKGRYRGQRQKWFAMRLNGGDSLIDIATADPEFNAWRWTSLATLPDVIVPFKRDLYAALAEEFKVWAVSA